MNRRRLLVPVFAAVLAGPLLTPGAAVAGNRNEPILGDLNRDGYVDRVTLGPDTGTPTGTPTCTVNVEYGKRDGTFRAPVPHTYASPWPRQPFCPNMGEAINLGKRGQLELVLTHFNISTSPELLVLKNFEPVAQFPGLDFPSTIRSEDFNGDGRTDIWESTDEFSHLKTFTNTPDGTLVPGPIDVCSRDPIPQHEFADFNGDGGADFLAVINCRTTSSAQVLFGNGQPIVTLASTTTNSSVYQVFVEDINADGIPDAGVNDATTGTVRHFRNDGHGVFTEVS